MISDVFEAKPRPKKVYGLTTQNILNWIYVTYKVLWICFVSVSI